MKMKGLFRVSTMDLLYKRTPDFQELKFHLFFLPTNWPILFYFQPTSRTNWFNATSFGSLPLLHSPSNFPTFKCTVKCKSESSSLNSNHWFLYPPSKIWPTSRSHLNDQDRMSEADSYQQFQSILKASLRLFNDYYYFFPLQLFFEPDQQHDNFVYPLEDTIETHAKVSYVQPRDSRPTPPLSFDRPNIGSTCDRS